MCAICGIVDFGGASVSRQALVRMRDEMLNRGPEVGGEHVDGAVALGHRRLRIIDLSPAGNQPMTNEDRTVWVVFNGEIYNFQALRPELERRGHRFASHGDTEVIVHGYEEWGEQLIEKLDGMFALAIWDGPRRRLLLARDRFGKKPLYVWRRGTTVSFASEIKALATLPDFSREVDPAAIDCYLHHLGTTQEHAIYRGVEKVRPAHYEVWSEAGRRVERYWRPEYHGKLDLSEGEVLERIDEALRAAVRKRLISDVPLGAFLSGGVDSSLIVAMTAQLSDRPVKTFSIGFRDQDFSELGYARQVAERYGTDHEEITLEPDVLRVLPQLVWEYGEPFADSSAVPTFYVSQGARRFVTVALSGDGGDEMFGGYDTARAAWWSQQYHALLPGPLRAPLERLLVSTPLVEEHPGLRKLRTVAVGASEDPAVRMRASMAFSAEARARLYTDAFRASLDGDPAMRTYDAHWAELAGLDLVDQNLLLTLHTRLPNDYLVKVDVASMKVALELRSPFLDTALCELSCAIDPKLKVRLGRQKYLLKRLAERYLPHDVIYRPKRGFELPLARWLRTDLAPVLRRFLPDGRAIERGWFRREEVVRLMEEHLSGKAEHTHRLWALLWLELWHRLFIDQTLTPDDDLR
jgi:asparagine synthase (glutamine-hydrolysing)